jgi:hypothetical protein
MMGHIPHNVCAGFFKDIVDGKLALKGLPATCTRWKATHHLQMHILEVAKHARPDKHITDWDMLAKVFPALCSQKFIDGWVTSIKVKHDKISDAPPGLKQAIQEQCEERKVHTRLREGGG